MRKEKYYQHHENQNHRKNWPDYQFTDHVENEFIKESGGILNRFMKKIKILDNGCWEWTGARDGYRYGVISYNGRRMGAHRVSWMLANKQNIESHDFICHKCDHPPCVNPDHLYRADAAGNSMDRSYKQRGIKAEILDLPKDKILQVRAHWNRTKNPAEVGKEHDISPTDVMEIVNHEWDWHKM